MSHKLHESSVANDGGNSVACTKTSTTNPSISSQDAAPSAASTPPDTRSIDDSTGNHQPGSAEEKSSISVAAELDGEADLQALRCEVARSVESDRTGEHAFPCGARADVVCEYCGPMCRTCAEDTFCYYGEHKLTELPHDGPIPAQRRLRGKISQVVYLELDCPKCKRVRLALPQKHRPMRVRTCPVCRSKARVEYLAHGFTRRRLPYHEVFILEKEQQPPEGAVFKRRMPWDRRPHWWVED